MQSPFDKVDKNKDFNNSKIVFVSDMHKNEYAGGAELSTDALMKTSPAEVSFLKSRDVTKELISQGTQKIWVFFNFGDINFELIPTIVANCHYFIVEYDYKFCQYRSIEKHKAAKNEECNCHQERFGMFISSFFAGAEHVFYMSEKQRQIYISRFPFLNKNSSVLSSVFDVNDLEFIERLRKARQENNEKYAFSTNGKYAIMGSNSWIKGVEYAKDHLRLQQADFDILQGLTYHDMLRKLSNYRGLCFMPLGGDTCPRLVIEAKLLGLELEINDNVQHASEEWFLQDYDQIESYLLNVHNVFWEKITEYIARVPTISGYTTIRNVFSQGYPWRKSIASLLQFCDEVVVVDCGSDDGSYEMIKEWSEKEKRIKLFQKIVDTKDPRFAVKVDGEMKAYARSLCSSDWCWQQDIDEVVHENDAPKIKSFAANLPKAIHLVALPVIEYWGDKGKVRVDVNPWKWRLSRNMEHITHGIPAELRLYDENGEMYANQGTDSCDYIDKDTGHRIPFSSFYTQEVHNARVAALQGDNNALTQYNAWFNAVISELPGVHHYSWYNLNQKITNYKNYWTRFWQSMYGEKQEDTAEKNMFFDKPWSEVSEEDIIEISQKLEREMGGWIFHKKIDWDNPTPFMTVNVTHPDIKL